MDKKIGKIKTFNLILVNDSNQKVCWVGESDGKNQESVQESLSEDNLQNYFSSSGSKFSKYTSSQQKKKIYFRGDIHFSEIKFRFNKKSRY